MKRLSGIMATSGLIGGAIAASERALDNIKTTRAEKRRKVERIINDRKPKPVEKSKALTKLLKNKGRR